MVGGRKEGGRECTIFKASPIIKTRSEFVIIAGFLIKYPAIITRSTACVLMRVFEETRTILTGEIEKNLKMKEMVA